MKTDDWDERVAAVWSQVDALAPEELVRSIDALADELALEPQSSARALFERACARDTSGLEADAERLYRAALATPGLDAYRRCRAAIQLGSTLRILGRLDESETLLVQELDRHLLPGDARLLHDEARATLALTYAAQGRTREAAGLALCALAPRLSRYKRSMLGNAKLLVERCWD